MTETVQTDNLLTMKLPVLHSEAEFRTWLRGLCDKSSPGAVAEQFGIQPSFLSNLLAGRAPIGPDTARRFGYRRQRTVTFIPLNHPEDSGKSH